MIDRLISENALKKAFQVGENCIGCRHEHHCVNDDDVIPRRKVCGILDDMSKAYSMRLPVSIPKAARVVADKYNLPYFDLVELMQTVAPHIAPDRDEDTTPNG